MLKGSPLRRIPSFLQLSLQTFDNRTICVANHLQRLLQLHHLARRWRLSCWDPAKKLRTRSCRSLRPLLRRRPGTQKNLDPSRRNFRLSPSLANDGTTYWDAKVIVRTHNRKTLLNTLKQCEVRAKMASVAKILCHWASLPLFTLQKKCVVQLLTVMLLNFSNDGCSRCRFDVIVRKLSVWSLDFCNLTMLLDGRCAHVLCESHCTAIIRVHLPSTAPSTTMMSNSWPRGETVETRFFG